MMDRNRRDIRAPLDADLSFPPCPLTRRMQSLLARADVGQRVKQRNRTMPPLRGLMLLRRVQAMEFKLPEEERKQILDGVEKDFKGTVRMTFAGLLPEKADAELEKWLQAKAEGQDPKMALALMRDLFDLDTVMAFKEAKVPVRCINSAGGYQLFTPTAAETNKKYADFGAVIIEGAGHYPMLEKPDEFNPELRDVLKEFATKM